MRSGYRVLCFIVILSLTGCGTIELREAQDSYADAVRIESEIRAGSEGGESLMSLSAAQLAYKDTLAKLDQVIEDKGSELRGNRLLGSARVMRALILWRITALDFDEVSGVCQKRDDGGITKPEDEMRQAWFEELQTIEKGLEKDLFLGTRDRTVFRSLYGLYGFDILKRIDYASPDVDIGCSIDWARQSLAHFEKAAQIPGPEHEIHKWLALSNLTLQADYLSRLSRTVGVDPWLNAGYEPEAYVLKAICPARRFWDDDAEEERQYFENLKARAKGVGVFLSQQTECP